MLDASSDLKLAVVETLLCEDRSAVELLARQVAECETSDERNAIANLLSDRLQEMKIDQTAVFEDWSII